MSVFERKCVSNKERQVGVARNERLHQDLEV